MRRKWTGAREVGRNTEKKGNEEEAGKVINDRKQVENSRLRNLCAKYTGAEKTCTKFCEMIGWFLSERLLFSFPSYRRKTTFYRISHRNTHL